MAHPILKILIVDDDIGDRKNVTRALSQAGLPCECVETVSIDAALESCGKQTFDCAIVDYRMPGHDGLHGIAALHEHAPNMPIIMATGQGDEIVATEAMKRGAADYVPKGRIQAVSIRRIIENAVEKGVLRRKVAQQREELENFSRVLVHDLKAPLCSMQGFADLAGLRAQCGQFGEIASYCREISEAAQRMNAMIDTLAEYTMADSQVEFTPLEMHRVLEDTVSNLDHLIQSRKAQVTHGHLPSVVGNSPQLIQLMQNLISNGIKYCESFVSRVHVTSCLRKDGMWQFSVEDNGIGIPERHLATIFEPFKRLHGANEYEGTGLGLATCKKIVERHGGTIRCESSVGNGTTFLFTLQEA